MAIRVQLTDATVDVGGKFDEVIAFIRRLPGRRYSDKVNHVELTLKEFARQCGYPYDVVNATDAHRAGQHVTRYGTRYGRGEWNAKKEIEGIEAEVNNQFAARYDALDADLKAQVASLGLDPRIIDVLRRGDLSELVEAGRVCFTSKEREEAIFTLEKWYFRSLTDLDGERGDVAASATQSIRQQVELY